MSTDPMAEIRASFFVECEDLLESLQDALNVMDAGDADAETVNVVFRAVHSIKGGAGAFGLDALVGFAHRFETVLDELRSGRISADGEAVRLFFQAADLLQDHVRAARDDGAPPDGAEATLVALEALMGGPKVEEEPASLGFVPMGLSFDFGGGDDAEPAPEAAPEAETEAGADDANRPRFWTVRLTPQVGLYGSGNETLHLLRSLAALGKSHVTCIVPDDLDLDESVAESPRLTWEVTIGGDIGRAEIEELFDFVSDVCQFDIAAATAMPTTPSDPIRPAIPSGNGAPAMPAESAPPAPDASAGAPLSDDPPAGQRPLSLVPPPRPATPEPTGDKTVEQGPATVRVDLEKIDRLVNLVGELVINQAMLSQSVSQSGDADPEVTAGLEAFMTLTRDIQDSVMSVRAQPVKPLFQRMARIVREASSSVGKAVRLKTEGEGTEVDKTVIERLADPLTHMIRNSVDHGLETPEVRLAAGKSREGQITLAAFHRAGRILIEVSDDGAGINRPKVLATAIAKGLVASDAILTDAEIDNLLFLPGFSTADRVSALSGRGVGMDVVKSSITALGGRIAIASEAGKGTTLSISLPLTLAVLDGMVVTAAGQTFVIPLSAIVETAKLSPDAIKRVGGNTELLHMRGDLIPLVDLAVRLGFRTRAEVNRSGIVLLTAQDDGSRAALIVDGIMEQRQVVIKGLGAMFGPMPGVAAATILGDGKIALILDPADLTQKPRGQNAADLPLAG